MYGLVNEDKHLIGHNYNMTLRVSKYLPAIHK